MSSDQQTVESRASAVAIADTRVKSLNKLRKAELARVLATLPPHLVETALLDEAADSDRAAKAAKAYQKAELTPRAERQRTFQSAAAIFNNRMSVVDCIIRNRTPEGFMIEAANSLSIPAFFELQSRMTDKRWPVKVIWRDGNKLGLAIEG